MARNRQNKENVDSEFDSFSEELIEESVEEQKEAPVKKPAKKKKYGKFSKISKRDGLNFI